MGFIATIETDGHNFTLLSCTCQLFQKHDSAGNPISGVRGGVLDFIALASDDDTFFSWISDPAATKDGVINFYGGEEKIKEIKFQDAYVIELIESFAIDEYLPFLEKERRSDVVDTQMGGGYNYLLQCAISAKIVTIDGQKHDNKW